MIGSVMQQQMTRADRKFKTKRLLVNPPFCQKLFLTHFYIKWLVEHNVVIHDIHRIVEYPLCSAPFRQLGEFICEQRQMAAASGATTSAKARPNKWKLVGNSIYGQFCMQPDNFTQTHYTNLDRMVKLTNLRKTVAVNSYGPDMFETTVVKQNVTVKQCPQMAVGVYQHAKLRMIDFEHELSQLLDRRKYCLVLTDTDSYYLALAHDTWEECVNDTVTPDRLLEFKHKFFCMSEEKSKYMGLFHVEFDGHTIVALQPKMYCAVADDSTLKTATRGIQKRDNPVTIDLFKNILRTAAAAATQTDEPKRKVPVLEQRSFRVVNNSVVTMRMETSALNAFYYKRRVLDNNIDTVSLDWQWPPQFDQ